MHGGKLRIRHGKRAAVGGNNPDSGLQKVCIALVDGFGIGAVYKEGAFGSHVDYGIYIRPRSVDDRMAGKVYSVTLAVGLADYQEAFSGAGLNVLRRTLYHVVKGMGHGAVSGNEKAQFLYGKFLEKYPVKGSQGLLKHFFTNLKLDSGLRLLNAQGRYPLREKGLADFFGTVFPAAYNRNDVFLGSHAYPAV